MSQAAPYPEPTPSVPAEPVPVERPRRRLAPDERREQIVTVGSAVFTARGYQGTSLEDIAASVGVTRPLIYRYFRDKDELYREIMRRARAELDATLIAAVDPTASAQDQLHSGLAAYFTFVRDKDQEWDLLFGGGTAIAGAVAADAAVMRFETAEMVATLVRAAATELDPTAASAYAHAISGAAEQLAKWWRHHPEVTLQTIVDYHLDVVWQGLDRISSVRR